jgi:hypothetical protein
MTQANKDLRKQYGKIDVDKIEVRASTAPSLSWKRIPETRTSFFFF